MFWWRNNEAKCAEKVPTNVSNLEYYYYLNCRNKAPSQIWQYFRFPQHLTWISSTYDFENWNEICVGKPKNYFDFWLKSQKPNAIGNVYVLRCNHRLCAVNIWNVSSKPGWMVNAFKSICLFQNETDAPILCLEPGVFGVENCICDTICAVCIMLHQVYNVYCAHGMQNSSNTNELLIAQVLWIFS